jgi:hypothetical protein
MKAGPNCGERTVFNTKAAGAIDARALSFIRG